MGPDPANRDYPASARYWWISLTAMAPSPTAEATRLIEPARASPAAKTPGTLVSRRSGSRERSCQRSPSSTERSRAAPPEAAVLPPQAGRLLRNGGAGTELISLHEDAAGEFEARQSGGKARVILYPGARARLPTEGDRLEGEGGEALRGPVDRSAEARRTCADHNEVVGPLQGGVYLEARGTGKLQVRRVLQHVLALPDCHGRLRRLGAQPLEEGACPRIALQFDPDVGHPVAGRKLPEPRRVARVARAYDPEAEALPHHVRAPGQEGPEDDIRDVGLLGDDLLQPLAGNGQHLPGLAHHASQVHRLPGEHVQFAQETALVESSYRPRLAGEVVAHLHLAFQHDHKIVIGIARPEKDLTDLRLPGLPVALEDLDLVRPQPRGPRAANLIHPITHATTHL